MAPLGAESANDETGGDTCTWDVNKKGTLLPVNMEPHFLVGSCFHLQKGGFLRVSKLGYRHVTSLDSSDLGIGLALGLLLGANN